ncbi:MAG: YcxB family protein [Calditrichaeota bacterium]|nr:MAG: YcxB family protein [Calditrichota bacterium]
MTITYENSPKDITAYGTLLYTKSPTVKQHRNKALKYAVLLSVIIGLVIYFTSDDISILYFWTALSVGWWIYIPIQHRRKYIKNMIATYADDTHKNLFGKHELTIDETGLTDKIEQGQNITSWGDIEHVEVSENIIYIFIRSSLAYLIVKENISEGSFEQFSESIGRYK